jgi:predicted O-methyltransferase YrrM
MSRELWASVDRYISDHLVPTDPVLAAALEESAAAGLPDISVAPNQGKLLMLLARSIHAKRILEIGTLGGYSTIWLARALPEDGKLITLEYEPKHAEVARANIARARLDRLVEVHVGPALETLAVVRENHPEPFDLIFIDADKTNNPGYLEWALKLSHIGSLIVIDNVVRGGDVIDHEKNDPGLLGVRRMNEMLAAEPRVIATQIQTVGVKGYDGIALALVVA